MNCLHCHLPLQTIFSPEGKTCDCDKDDFSLLAARGDNRSVGDLENKRTPADAQARSGGYVQRPTGNQDRVFR